MIKLMDLLDEAKGHTGGAAKKFEDDIITLAILSTKNKKEKNLYTAFESKNNLVIDVPKNTTRETWFEIAKIIETACRNL